jgi:endonuclease G
MKMQREEVFRQIAGDDDLWAEIKAKLSPAGGVEFSEWMGIPRETLAPDTGLEWGLPMLGPDEMEGFRETPEDLFAPENLGKEAIIRFLGRPVLKIRNDDFDVAELQTDTWKARLQQFHDNLKAVILSVGRVEVENNASYRWVGTGWVVAEDVIVTNRHVAKVFGQKQDSRFLFRSSFLGEMAARLDFREEHQGGTPAEFHITEILHIEGDKGPDMALLRIDWAGKAPRAIIPLAGSAAEEQMVATVGYPAKDSRTDVPEEMDRIFGNIYDVKRLAPGQIMKFNPAKDLFAHDCTTLGGNSGSVVCDMATGEAVGLHFAGREEVGNYAVAAPKVKERLDEILGTAPAPDEPGPVVIEPSAPGAEDLEDRTGYDADFLAKAVPLPRLSADLRQDIAPVLGRDDGLLHYTHYSVMMHRWRRIALYAVCNIDGGQWRRVPRGRDHWHFDPRMDRDFQVGNELYRSNKLDRGHLVRRLDPAWGERLDQARVAVEDTFYYTNCAPQHKDLNRDIWLDLEEHILGNTKVRDLRVTVFNGPIFRESDRLYRGIRIPEDFWKVVAMVRDDTGELSVTAYLLSQRDMMDDLEFAFGAFRTYQIPLKQLEELTDLDFGHLSEHDPLRDIEAAQPFVMLGSLEDIVV